MDLNAILQFILSLLGQGNSSPANTPQVSTQASINTIRIDRGAPEAHGIFGDGSLSWDSFTFESLENHLKVIPAGTYKLQWHTSAHLNGEVVPQLIDVPGRTEILMHEGNDEDCSEGCILIGTIRDGNAVDSSKSALALLKEKINAVGIENCQVTIA